MEMKQITNISLKNNSALKEFSNFAGLSNDESRSVIIKALLSCGYISDERVYCGFTLKSILKSNRVTVCGFARKCFHCTYPEFINILSGIVIWGVESGCPYCGCKTTVKDKVLKCSNTHCNFDMNLIPEKRVISGYTAIHLN
jgi:hypothetical protein